MGTGLVVLRIFLPHVFFLPLALCLLCLTLVMQFLLSRYSAHKKKQFGVDADSGQNISEHLGNFPKYQDETKIHLLEVFTHLAC